MRRTSRRGRLGHCHLDAGRTVPALGAAANATDSELVADALSARTASVPTTVSEAPMFESPER